MKHYFLKGKAAQETKSKVGKHYGESATSTRTVYRWFGYFHSGHMSTNDNEYSRWPVQVTTAENIEKSMIW